MPHDPSRAPLSLPAPPPLAAPAGLADALALAGTPLDAAQIQRLGDYLARLLAMNEQMNLTAITQPDEAWTRHIVDSLSLLPLLRDLPAGAALLDVGSGGGLPGVPLAIARPDLRVTLVEATQKKAAFLTAVAAALGLAHVTVIADRSERLARTPLARSFDVVTARAVGRTMPLLPWTAPFVRSGGRLLLLKGQRAEEELLEAKKALAYHHCTHERTETTPTGRIVVLRVA